MDVKDEQSHCDRVGVSFVFLWEPEVTVLEKALGYQVTSKLCRSFEFIKCWGETLRHTLVQINTLEVHAT